MAWRWAEISGTHTYASTSVLRGSPSGSAALCCGGICNGCRRCGGKTWDLGLYLTVLSIGCLIILLPIG
ncbi:MAG TPA: hypothetical protein ACN46O_05240 [Prochlorococcus sp.]